MRQWVKRNLAGTNGKEGDDQNRRKLFHLCSEETKLRGCAYCEDSGHKALRKGNLFIERKKILEKKGLCFNCATVECYSKASCWHCNKRHHSSICDKRPGNPKKLMRDCASVDGVFPVVVVKVNGVMCRALIDCGAGSSYASVKLISMINKQPRKVKTQQIDMLMATKTTRIEMYDTEVCSFDPLGLIFPTTLVAKQLYREMCEIKLPWDGELPESLKKRWIEWQDEIPTSITVPRTLPPVSTPLQR